MKRIVCLLMATCAAPAHGEERSRIDLPNGPMGEAIVALSRESGASVKLDDPALWHRPTPAVQGKLTVRAALERLTVGTDLEIARIGGRSWIVRRRERRPPVAPPPATVVTEPANIVVTGSKRSTRLADFAGTVVVLSGSDLAAPGPAGSAALGDRLASISSTHLGAGRDKLFIRGIADSGLVGQSQATVGQYLGDLRLTYNAPDPSLRLYDIGSVEVLEGPQGTLYGAGSPGGIIRLVRNAPVLDRTEGSVSAGLSSVAHGAIGWDGASMLNLPLATDKVALRLLGYADSAGGYIDVADGAKNVNRVDTQGGRAVLRVAPAEGWTVDLGGIVQHIGGRDAQYADQDLPALTRRSGLAQPYSDDYRMAELTVAKDWEGLRFSSSNAGSWQEVTERYDVSANPAAPALFRQRNRTRLATSENRLSRPMRDGWGWVIGASFLRNTARLTRATGVPGQTAPATGVLNRFSEQTGYGELSLEPLRSFTLTAGARVSRSRITGRALGEAGILRLESLAATQGSRTQTRVLPSFAISSRPGHGWLLFARYQEGYRPGGLGSGDGVIRRFDSDHVGTAEWGFRYDRPGDAAISLAASIAYTRWRDIQADFLDPSGLPVTTNIGDGRIWSFDARVAVRPVPSLRAELALLVNDSRLTRPDVTTFAAFRLNAAMAEIREDLPNVSQLGGRASIDWHRRMASGIEIGAGAWARYVGRTRLGIGPTLGRRQGDYVDTSLSARIGWGRHGVTVGIRNLLDVAGNRFALGTPLDFVGGREITPLVPRTVRIGFDTRF